MFYQVDVTILIFNLQVICGLVYRWLLKTYSGEDKIWQNVQNGI